MTPEERPNAESDSPTPPPEGHGSSEGEGPDPSAESEKSEASSEAQQTPERSEQPAPSEPPSPAAGRQLAMTPGVAILAALVGAVLALAVIAPTYPVAELTEEEQEISEMENPGTEEQARTLQAGIYRVGRNNAMFMMSVVAVLLGGALAVGEGTARRSPATALGAACLAVVLGIVLGLLSGFLGHLLYRAVSGSANIPVWAQSTLWQIVFLAPIGLGIGLAVSAPLKHPPTIVNTSLAGLLGGALAALLFGLLAPLIVILFPGAQTDTLVPETFSVQVLWLALIAVVVAFVITGLGQKKA